MGQKTEMNLGIIEGFYGRPWSWSEREEAVSFLGANGYGFYLYAPKADAFLRRRWREDHPPEMRAHLEAMSGHCRANGLRFGIGLSPYELYLDFGLEARAALRRKLAWLDAIGVQDLAILFDDMRGDVLGLAQRQVDIVHWVAERTSASRLILCPTYYSDDPVLDRIFGERPAGYLCELGRRLDPAVEVFWTGPEICSRDLSPGHLVRIGASLGRRPFLWDNYPVNDGQRMSKYLHVRGFTGRSAGIADLVSAHGVNPALQAVLSRIPALTLRESYRRGEEYDYHLATRSACDQVLGEDLSRLLREDLHILQDLGLDRLAERAEVLRARYGRVDHPAAREVVAWLDGAYAITDEIVQTQ